MNSSGNIDNSYILPFLVALGVHAVIAVILFMQINNVSKVEVKRPISIKASLVKLKPQLKTAPKKPKTARMDGIPRTRGRQIEGPPTGVL